MFSRKKDKLLIQKNSSNSKLGFDKSKLKDKLLIQKSPENIDLKKREFLKKGILGLAGFGGVVAFSKLTKAWSIFSFGDGTTQSTAASAVETIAIAASDETSNLTIGTAKATFRMPYAFTLTDVRASVTTAPTGTTLIVDINEAGTTILSTKLSIDVSEKTSTTAATAPVISDTALADDAEITIDIDQIGSTVAGTGLKVYLIGKQA